MISLQRLRTSGAINAKYRGAAKRERDIELMLAQRSFLIDNTKPISFRSAFWKTAKTQLKKESFGKCAYCEANTDVVAHGDVEHYRPKSIYWWLAYTYDNYLFACQICNQTYKSNNFPIRGVNLYPSPLLLDSSTDAEINLLAGNISPDPIDIGENYTLQTYSDEHFQEQALLLNPYFDNPEAYFAYEADDLTQEVKIIPRETQYAEYVKAAEDFYGINRIELKNLRYSVFKSFRIFKASIPAISDPNIRRDLEDQIEDMLSSSYNFAGMNRYFNTIL
ncbi:hypothetical protein GON26_02140 [Flavobacterium sp. GA093]|uniref:TIGR02646 family protein n=1 Tax=Flavobacterium hydrocarbonoxydans TaxID=2683249 RepID=A0A6I4NEZ6_9FLAO|nr:hypothetical protein [Flavobacterium hydrocarbonoxydans]MWB93146.1 hypothetical protein [Flavobacterium hydrocarbonoxydans]